MLDTMHDLDATMETLRRISGGQDAPLDPQSALYVFARFEEECEKHEHTDIYELRLRAYALAFALAEAINVPTRAAPMLKRIVQLKRALRVFILDRRTLAYLQQNDPQALKQAQRALVGVDDEDIPVGIDGPVMTLRRADKPECGEDVALVDDQGYVVARVDDYENGVYDRREREEIAAQLANLWNMVRSDGLGIDAKCPCGWPTCTGCREGQKIDAERANTVHPLASALVDLPRQIWETFTDSEKHGVRFGMFPHEKMPSEKSLTADEQRRLAVALMDLARGERP